jgi:hypothetical protein
MITSKLFYRTTYADHQAQAANFKQSHFIPCDPSVTAFVDSTPIVAQIEGSEGTHLNLEQNPNFHTMALLVAGSTLCAACVTALGAYGIVAADTMWLASKKLAAVHPELRATRF